MTRPNLSWYWHQIHMVTQWLLDGETGCSSKCMARVVVHVPMKYVVHPFDACDFRKCVLFVEAINGMKAHQWHALAALSPAWKAVCDNWDAWVALLDAEEPTWRDRGAIVRCPRLNEAMKQAGC